MDTVIVTVRQFAKTNKLTDRQAYSLLNVLEQLKLAEVSAKKNTDGKRGRGENVYTFSVSNATQHIANLLREAQR